MDLYNYMQEAANATNFNDFQQQKQEEYKQLAEQYQEQGLGIVVPIGIDLLKRGIDFAQNVSKNVNSVANTVSNAENGVINEMSSVGDRVAQNMRENAFNADPEASISDAQESMGLLDRAQSFFRGGNVASNTVSEAASTAEGAVSDAVDTAVSTAGKVAGSVAETAGSVVGGISEALGPLAELAAVGYGIYDIVKSFEHPNVELMAQAAPSLELGV